jgi:hypothetical protein
MLKKSFRLLLSYGKLVSKEQPVFALVIYMTAVTAALLYGPDLSETMETIYDFFGSSLPVSK